MRLLLFTIIIILFTTAHSQGYRGNRFSISYQPGYSVVGYLSEPFFLIGHHKFDVSYSISNHFSIGLNASYTKTKEKVYYWASSDNVFEIRDKLIGLKLSYFRKKQESFSPFGRYFAVGFDFGMQNTLRTELVYSNEYKEGVKERYFYDSKYRNNVGILSFYFGRNFLIKQRFLFGYGFQAGLKVLNYKNQPMRHFAKPHFNIGYIF